MFDEIGISKNEHLGKLSITEQYFLISVVLVAVSKIRSDSSSFVSHFVTHRKLFFKNKSCFFCSEHKNQNKRGESKNQGALNIFFFFFFFMTFQFLLAEQVSRNDLSFH